MERAVEVTVAPSAKQVAALPPLKGMADTPDLLANALVRAVGTSGADSWLDPSAGSGQLVQAVLRAGVATESILAIDLQTQLPTLDRLGVESLLGTDFLQWARRTDRRFDRVIANPPFVRLRELEENLFRPALETRLNEVSISATANYWAAFLVAGMTLLKPGGSLAYILPAAWEYANYASRLRDLCVASFQELEVHRVSVPMFEGVSDGSVLLVGRGFGWLHRRIRVIRHQTLPALDKAVRGRDASISTGEMRLLQGSCLPEGQMRFGQIAKIRIGAVTGDARYFLLSEARRLKLGLPLSAVRPVLSKARHIVASEIDRDAWARLLAAGQRVWLFYPSDSDLSDPSVRAYLNLTEGEGGCHRGAMKIRDRKPWYRVPTPSSFDGFVSGMSQTTPWVAFNRMPCLTASNTLYGIRFPAIENLDERASWCLSMLSSTTAESRSRLIRQYPQGLLKLEPSDIASLAVRRPKTTAGALHVYRRATQLIMAGCAEAAQTLADEWLE